MVKQKEKLTIQSLQPSLQLGLRYLSLVGFPIIIAAFLGKWLDKKFSSDPWIFLSLIGFSFLISMFALIVNVNKDFQKIAKTMIKSKEQTHNNNNNQIDNKQ